MIKLLVALHLLDRMERAVDAGTRTIFPMGPFFSIGPLRGPSHEAKSRVDAASIRLEQSPVDCPFPSCQTNWPYEAVRIDRFGQSTSLDNPLSSK